MELPHLNRRTFGLVWKVKTGTPVNLFALPPVVTAANAITSKVESWSATGRTFICLFPWRVREVVGRRDCGGHWTCRERGGGGVGGGGGGGDTGVVVLQIGPGPKTPYKRF